MSGRAGCAVTACVIGIPAEAVGPAVMPIGKIAVAVVTRVVLVSVAGRGVLPVVVGIVGGVGGCG
jgi:hypothetical protein